MNASFGDVFNDGRPAIYKTNISEPGVLVQGNDLWVPARRAATAEDSALAFENLASGLGVDLGGWSWGAQFGDLNNDGTQDLYLTNGYVSAGERSSYWYDFSVIAVGHSTIIGDAANWPAMRGRSLSGYQRKRVWLNDGLGTFTEVAQAVGATDAFDGRAVALADFGNRGALDVVVANQRGPLLLYRNTVDPARHWIDFELEGTPSNRSAIGARVELHWAGKVQRQDLVAASGFSAQNQRRLHFGLGAATQVERAVITWPSGQQDTLDQPRAWTACTGSRSCRNELAQARQPLPAAAAHHRDPADGAFLVRHPRGSGAHRRWRSPPPSSPSWCWAASPTASGCTRPAPTSPASASASCCGRRSCGRTSCARSSRSCPSTSLRIGPKHLWNPSNLGVSLVLFLAPETVSLLSVQWGNVVAPMVVIWLLGSVIVYRVGRFHLSATYVASFLAVLGRAVDGDRARRGWPTWRRSPGRCTSCSSSSWSPTPRPRSVPSGRSAWWCSSSRSSRWCCG